MRIFARIAVITTLLLVASPALAEPRILTMTGQGEARDVPDQVAISTGVTTNAATAAAALAANTTRMHGVFSALDRLGVPAKNIQTVNFSISPQYSNGENNQAPRLTGYQVNNEVHVLLDDVGKLGGALDALVTAGANQMNGISFSIRDTKPLLEKARTDAVADARVRAQTYAKAAGVQLGAIQSISEGGDGPRPVMYAPMMMKAAGAVPVAAGQESVSASVSIVWEIH